MNLGAYHALLAEHRADLHVSKYQFIGQMLESAAVGVTYAELNSTAGKQYEVSCRHVFSQSPTRIPISKVKARAILYQKEERFDYLVSYLADNILDLSGIKEIIREIIQTDCLQINQSLFTWEEPKYTDFLSYLEDVPDLIAAQQIRICAAYLAEYFYYCLLWCQIDYALPGMDELHQSFHMDERFYQELIDCFRYTAQDSQNNVFVRRIFACEPYTVIQQGTDISVFENSVKVKQFTIPSRLARQILLEQTILRNNYTIFLSDDVLLIYKGTKFSQMPYRIIRKPSSRNPGENDRFLKMEFLDQDGSEDNGILIILANHYYLKIKLNQLNWNSPDKMKKTGQTTPDYELHEIEVLPASICSEIQLKNEVAAFHSLSDNIIYAHKLDLESGICETSNPLYQLRGEFEDHIAYISTNHRYVLLNTQRSPRGGESAKRTSHAILLDLDDRTRFIELLQPTPIEDDDYIVRLVKLQNSKSLSNYEFSKDNRFFAFSTAESLPSENGADCRCVTEIVDLQAMTRNKIEMNGSDQYSFVGFMNDQILVKGIGANSDDCYEQVSLNALFSD